MSRRIDEEEREMDSYDYDNYHDIYNEDRFSDYDGDYDDSKDTYILQSKRDSLLEELDSYLLKDDERRKEIFELEYENIEEEISALEYFISEVKSTTTARDNNLKKKEKFYEDRAKFLKRISNDLKSKREGIINNVELISKVSTGSNTFELPTNVNMESIGEAKYAEGEHEKTIKLLEKYISSLEKQREVMRLPRDVIELIDDNSLGGLGNLFTLIDEKLNDGGGIGRAILEDIGRAYDLSDWGDDSRVLKGMMLNNFNANVLPNTSLINEYDTKEINHNIAEAKKWKRQLRVNLEEIKDFIKGDVGKPNESQNKEDIEIANLIKDIEALETSGGNNNAEELEKQIYESLERGEVNDAVNKFFDRRKQIPNEKRILKNIAELYDVSPKLLGDVHKNTFYSILNNKHKMEGFVPDFSEIIRRDQLNPEELIKEKKELLAKLQKNKESKNESLEDYDSNFSKSSKPKVRKRTRESDEKYLKELYEELDEAEHILEEGNLDISLLEELRDYGFTRLNADAHIRSMHNEGRQVDIAKYLSKAYELPLPDNLEDLHTLDVIDLNKKLQKDAEKKSKEGFVPDVSSMIEEIRGRYREYINSLKKRISDTQKRLDNYEPKKTSSTKTKPKTKLDDDYEKQSLEDVSLGADANFDENGHHIPEGYTPTFSGKFVDEVLGDIEETLNKLGVGNNSIRKFVAKYQGSEDYEGDLQKLRDVLSGLEDYDEDTSNLATELIKLVERERETEGTFQAVIDAYVNAGFKSEIGDGVGQAVHHLNGYNWDYDGRVDPNNLILLSGEIHDQFHSIYGAGNNSIEQFLEFLYNYHPEEVNKFWDAYMKPYGNPKNMTNKLDEAKPNWNGRTKTLQDNRVYDLPYRSELDEITSNPVPENIPYSSFFLPRMEVPVDEPYLSGNQTISMAQLGTSDPKVLDIYDANTEASMKRYREMKSFSDLKNALISRRLVETVNGLYDGHDWNEETRSFDSIDEIKSRDEMLLELEKSHALGREWLEGRVDGSIGIKSPSRQKSTNSDILYNLGMGGELDDLSDGVYVPEPSEIGHGLIHVIDKVKKFFDDYKYIFLRKDENFENPLKDWDSEGDISPGSPNERIFSMLFRNGGFDNNLLAKVINNLPIDDEEGISTSWNPAKARERRFYTEVKEEKLKENPDSEKMAFKDIITDLKYIDGIARNGVSNETIERFFKNDGSRKSLVNPDHQKGAFGREFAPNTNTSAFDAKLKAIVDEGGKIHVSGGEPEYILAKLLQENADPRSWINNLNGMMVVPNAEGIAQADEIREKALVQELRKMVGEYLKHEMENLPLYERKDFATRNDILRRANDATSSKELSSIIASEFSEDTRKRYYWNKNRSRKLDSEEEKVESAEDKDLIKLSDPSCCKLLREIVEKINEGIQALVKAFENGNFIVQKGSESNTSTRTYDNGTTETITKNDDGTVSQTISRKHGTSTTYTVKPLEYDDRGGFKTKPDNNSEFEDDGRINYRNRKKNLNDLYLHGSTEEIRDWAKRGLDVAKEMTSAGGFQGRKANQDLLEATVGYVPKEGWTREQLLGFERKYRALQEKLNFSDSIDIDALDSTIRVFESLTRYDTKEQVDLDDFNEKRERLREALLMNDPLYLEWKELDDELRRWESSPTLNESAHQERKIEELENAKLDLERKGLRSTFAETQAIIDAYDKLGAEFDNGASSVNNPMFALLGNLKGVRGQKLSDEERYVVTRQMMGYELALGTNSPNVDASLHGLYNTTLLDLMKAISKGEDWEGLEAQREHYALQLGAEGGSVEKETFWQLLKTIDEKEKYINRSNITDKTRKKHEKRKEDLETLKAHIVDIMGKELTDEWIEEYYAPTEKVNKSRKYKVTDSKSESSYKVEGYKDWQGAVARGDVPFEDEDEGWGVFAGNNEVPYPPVTDPFSRYKIIPKTLLDPKIVQQIERIKKDINKTRERLVSTKSDALKGMLLDALARKEALVRDLMIDAQVDPETREKIRNLRAEIRELEEERDNAVSDADKERIGEELISKRKGIVDLLPGVSYEAPTMSDLYDSTSEAYKLIGHTETNVSGDFSDLFDTRWDFLRSQYGKLKEQILPLQDAVVAPNVSNETIEEFNELIRKLTQIHDAINRLKEESPLDEKWVDEINTVTGDFDNLTKPIEKLKEENTQKSFEKEPLHGRLTSMAYNFDRATRSANQLSGVLTKLFAIVGTGNAVNDMITASSLRQTNQIMLASRRGMEEAQKLYDRIQMLVVKLPGNDTFLTNILTMLGTMDESLSAEDLEYMGGVIADYYMAAQAKGQFNNETERELRNYLMTGQTRNLTNSVLASEIESLKNLNSVKERTIALEKALKATGMDSIAHYDSYTNSLEEFKGRFQKAFADLGDLYLGLLQGLMKIYNFFDNLSNSALSQFVITIAVTTLGIIAFTGVVAELLSISAGLIEALDVMHTLITKNDRQYSGLAQTFRKVIAWIGLKIGFVDADTASQVINTDAVEMNTLSVIKNSLSSAKNALVKRGLSWSNITETLSRIWNTVAIYGEVVALDEEIIATLESTEAKEFNSFAKAYNTYVSTGEAKARIWSAMATGAETEAEVANTESKTLNTSATIGNIWAKITKIATDISSIISTTSEAMAEQYSLWIKGEVTFMTFLEGEANIFLTGTIEALKIALGPVGAIFEIIGDSLWVFIMLAMMLIPIIANVGESFGVWGAIWAPIESVLNGISGFIGMVVGGIKRLWDAFMNSEPIQYIITTFQNLSYTLGTLFNWITSIGGNIWQTIFGVDDGSKSQVFDIVGVFLEVVGFIGKIAFMTSPLKIILDIINAIGSSIAWFLTTWNKFVRSDEFQAVLKSFQDIRKTLGETWNIMKQAFGEVYNSLVDVKNAFMSIFQDDSTKKTTDDFNVLLELLKALAWLLNNTIVPVLKAVAGIFKGIAQVIKGVADIFSWVIGLFTNTGDYFNNFLGSVKLLVDNIVMEFASIPSRVAESIANGVTGGLYGSVMNVIEGFNNPSKLDSSKHLAQNYNHQVHNSPTIINNNFEKGSVQADARNMTAKDVQRLFVGAFGYNKARGVNGVLN